MKDFDYKNYLKSNPLLKVDEKKDHDGDGDIDSDDYLIAKDKAIKKAKGEANEEVTPEEEDKLKDIEGELNKASQMHKSQANRIGKIVKESDLKAYIKEIIKSTINEVKKDEYGNHLEPQFKKGDKVTYLGNPGEITKVNKTASGTYTYSVSYDKGTGKTKASDLYNKGGEIKKA
jgi:hypothetical protein